MGTHDRGSFLARHKPSLIVLASQVSAAIVHGVVKSLETTSSSNANGAVDPFQILLVRMVITGVACSAYLWFKRVPDFPWGHHDVRHILLLRAFGGVLGAGGMYCEFVFASPSVHCFFSFDVQKCLIKCIAELCELNLTQLNTNSTT